MLLILTPFHFLYQTPNPPFYIDPIAQGLMLGKIPAQRKATHRALITFQPDSILTHATPSLL